MPRYRNPTFHFKGLIKPQLGEGDSHIAAPSGKLAAAVVKVFNKVAARA
jgi:hypothetical protein